MDGKDEPSGGRGLRPAVPHPDGPLSSSGAAPDPATSPADTPPADTETVDTTVDSNAADTATTDSTTADTATTDSTAGSGPTDGTTADGTTADGTGADGTGADGTGADKPAAVGGGRGRRLLRRLRPGRLHPVGAARAAGRATMTWARRPSGRVIVPGVLAALLVGGAGAAGAYLVPEAIDAVPSTGASPPLGSDARAPAGVPVAPGSAGPGNPAAGLPGSGAPGLPPGPSAPTAGAPGQAAAPGARPADALGGWAQQVGTKVGIPTVAAQAYGYTELVLSRTAPACHLSWTTIAALAKVESDHGSANSSVLGVDGQTQPAIVGLPLDGKGGRQLVKDTDQGTLDGDTAFDRAMGPLQFIPSTWRQNAVDADNNGTTDPNDIDDAALTAGMYLCRDGRDMSKADEWWSAILSYNDVQPYAQQVFTEANGYGTRSRT